MAPPRWVDELPAEWEQYTEINKQFFLDNPGVRLDTEG